MSADSRLVYGRKDIARTLECSVRTVVRAEKRLGLTDARVDLAGKTVRYSARAMDKLGWWRRITTGE